MTDLEAHIALTHRQATTNYRVPVLEIPLGPLPRVEQMLFPDTSDLEPKPQPIETRTTVMPLDGVEAHGELAPMKRGPGRPRKHHQIEAIAYAEAGAQSEGGGGSIVVGFIEPFSIDDLDFSVLFQATSEPAPTARRAGEGAADEPFAAGESHVQPEPLPQE